MQFTGNRRIITLIFTLLLVFKTNANFNFFTDSFPIVLKLLNSEQQNVFKDLINPIKQAMEVGRVNQDWNPVVYEKTPFTQSFVLSNLFDLNAKEIKSKKEDESYETNYISPPNNINQLPNFLMNMYKSTLDHNQLNETTALKQYLYDIRSSAWGEFKKIIVQSAGLIDEKNHLSENDKVSLDIISNVLDLGDRVNLVHLFGKKIEPELLNYLFDNLEPYISNVPYIKNVLYLFKGNNTMMFPVSELMQSAALKTLQQFAQQIVKSAKPHVTDSEILQYYHTLKKSNPVVASGLKLILQLKDNDEYFNRGGQSKEIQKVSVKQKNGKRNRRNSARQFGNGLNTQIQINPYLILAGIGAAALMTFLAYRVIVTTKSGRAFNKRDLDLGMMDQTDSPGLISSIYNFIENAHEKYDPTYETSDDLAYNLNNLWHEYLNSDGCLRCQLFNYVKKSMNNNVGYFNTLFA